MSAFTEKGLRFLFQLEDGQTFVNQSTTLTQDKLWATLTSYAIVSMMPSVEVDIYGMSQSQMDALTALQFVNSTTIRIGRNKLIVYASNDVSSGVWTQIYGGTITNAYPDFSEMPNVKFHISSMGFYRESLTVISDTSYKGNVRVSAVAKAILAKLDTPYNLVNQVPSEIIIPKAIHLRGSPRAQLNDLGIIGGVRFTYENDNIFMTPKDMKGTGAVVWDVSIGNGLLDYPAYTVDGLYVKTLFDPGRYSIFKTNLAVNSSLKYARGIWTPYHVQVNLSTRAETASWQAVYQCLNPNSG